MLGTTKSDSNTTTLEPLTTTTIRTSLSSQSRNPTERFLANQPANFTSLHTHATVFQPRDSSPLTTPDLPSVFPHLDLLPDRFPSSSRRQASDPSSKRVTIT